MNKKSNGNKLRNQIKTKRLTRRNLKRPFHTVQSGTKRSLEEGRGEQKCKKRQKINKIRILRKTIPFNKEFPRRPFHTVQSGAKSSLEGGGGEQKQQNGKSNKNLLRTLRKTIRFNKMNHRKLFHAWLLWPGTVPENNRKQFQKMFFFNENHSNKLIALF